MCTRINVGLDWRKEEEESSDSFETSHGGNPVIASGPVSTTIHSNFEATGW